MNGNKRHGIGVFTFVDFDNMWIVTGECLFNVLAPVMGNDAARRIVKIFSPITLLERLKSVVEREEGAPLQTRCYFDLFRQRKNFPPAVCLRANAMGIELIHCAKQPSPRAKDRGSERERRDVDPSKAKDRGSERERRDKDTVDPLLADSAARLELGAKGNVAFAIATHDADFVLATMSRFRDIRRRVVALVISGGRAQKVRRVSNAVYELWFPEFVSFAKCVWRLSQKNTVDDVRELVRSAPLDFNSFGSAIRGIQRVLEDGSSFGEDTHIFADQLSEIQQGNGQPCSREDLAGIVSALEFLRVLKPRGEVLILDTAHPIAKWATEEDSS